MADEYQTFAPIMLWSVDATHQHLDPFWIRLALHYQSRWDGDDAVYALGRGILLVTVPRCHQFILAQH